MRILDEPVFVGPFAVHLFRQPDGAPMVDGGTIDRTELEDGAVVRVLQAASAHVAGVAPVDHLAEAVRAMENTARQRRFGALAFRIPGTRRALMVGSTLIQRPPPTPAVAVRMIRNRIMGAIFGTGPAQERTVGDAGDDDPDTAAALQRDSEGEAMPRGYL